MRSVTVGILAPSLFVAACSSHSTNAASASGSGTVSTPHGDTTAVDAVVATSGSRLRARYLTTADGARHFVGWHDSARNEDCTFALTQDGFTRCLPSAVPASATSIYIDASCTQSVWTLSSPSGVAPAPCGVSFISEQVIVPGRGGNTCGQSQYGAVIHPASPVGPSATLYSGSAGNCTALVPGSVGANTYYTAGAAIPASSFVDATEQVDQGDGLVAKHLVASDGARELTGWRIGNTGSDCAFQVLTNNEVRCLPTPVQGNAIYADASCLAPSFLQGYSSGCGAPDGMWFERDRTATVCPHVANVYRVGARAATPSSAFELESGGTTASCTSISMSSYVTLYSLGSDVKGSLPRIDRVGTGTTRLVPALVSTPSSSVSALVRGWFDTQLGIDCAFALAADGKTRCMPVAASATVFFTDATCTSSTRLAVLGPPACDGGSPFALEAVSGTCPVSQRVYAVGAARAAGTGSVSLGGNRCATVQNIVTAYDATPVDLAQFAEATLATE